LQETIDRLEKDKKKKEKKQRQIDAKSELRKKMSVIASNAMEDDDDLRLDKHVWEKLQKKGFEGLEEQTSEEEEEEKDG